MKIKVTVRTAWGFIVLCAITFTIMAMPLALIPWAFIPGTPYVMWVCIFIPILAILCVK